MHELEILVRQLKTKLDLIAIPEQQGRAGGKQFQRRGMIPRQANDDKCYNCGKKGHFARFCYAKRNSRRSVNNILEGVDEDISQSDVPSMGTNEDSESEVVTTVDVAYNTKRHTRKYLDRNRPRQERCISSWNQYIQGQLDRR